MTMNQHTIPFEGDSLEAAKQYLRDNWVKGVDCPCCTQFVKRYKWSLHSGMSASLIAIYHETHGTTRIVEMRDIKQRHPALIASQGNFAKARFWGLLNQPDEVRADGCKNNGKWQLTEKGLSFVRQEIMVPKYAYVFNAQCFGHEGPAINIVESLGDKFNYRDLMRGAT